MNLANINGSIQTSVIGLLLVLSLLLPNVFRDARQMWRRLKPVPVAPQKEDTTQSSISPVG
jgi:rhamnose transport system permease protein